MKEIRNSSKKMSKGFTKIIDRKKNMGKTLFSLFLCLSLMLPFFSQRSYAGYVNTNLNTFIHDVQDVPTGYPGQEMEVKVRIGYNGLNGLSNPNSDVINNVRVRLSNDQSYLTTQNSPQKTQKNNPYKDSSDEDEQGEAQKDAWEEGYKAGKNNAYNNGLNYVYPVDGGVYPFEVNASLFTQEQKLGSLKKGEYKELSFKVNVRSDALKMKDSSGNTSDGYFGVPFTIWYDVPGASQTQNKTEFVNVFITESGEVKDSGTKTVAQAFVVGENQSTPVGTYPNAMNYNVNFRNQSGKTLYDVKIKMNMSLAEKEAVQLTAAAKAEAVKDFPFSINEANYDRDYAKVEKGEVISPAYSMAIKQNAATGFYPLSYTVSYKLAPGSTVSVTDTYSFFVNVKNPNMVDVEKEKLRDFNANDRSKARIIVDSYRTEPEKVYAGDEFTLILNMKNASSSIAASNILFTLTSEKAQEQTVFAISEGSNSYVVNSLAAGASTELRLNVKANAGVDPKSYILTINEKYDSPDFKNAEEKVDIDIPVNQVARMGFSNFDVNPSSVPVGNEANAMFSINNTGRVMLYNVTANFENDYIKKTTAYVGNIKPGETGSVDVMLSAVKATDGETTIPVEISYEDVNGNKATEKTEITLTVTEAAEAESMDDAGGASRDLTERKPTSSLPIKGIGIGGAVVAVVGGAAYFIRKKRKKS